MGQGVEGAGEEDAGQVGGDAPGLGAAQQGVEAALAHVHQVGVEDGYVAVHAGQQ